MFSPGFRWSSLAQGECSLDGVIDARVAEEYNLGPPTVVPVRFALVQQVCGHYDNDSCDARDGNRCDVRGCPFLSANPVGLPSMFKEGGLDPIERRKVVLGGALALTAAVAGGAVAGATAGLGRVVGGAKSPGGQSVTLKPTAPSGPAVTGSGATTTSPATSTPGTAGPGTTIGLASEVPLGGAARFTDPKTGDPGLVLQLTEGRFVAFDAICPHAGCTVGYSSAAKLIVCPCHGSEFDPTTGGVVSPPASRGLSPIQVVVDANGELVVDG